MFQNSENMRAHKRGSQIQYSHIHTQMNHKRLSSFHPSGNDLCSLSDQAANVGTLSTSCRTSTIRGVFVDVYTARTDILELDSGVHRGDPSLLLLFANTPTNTGNLLGRPALGDDRSDGGVPKGVNVRAVAFCPGVVGVPSSPVGCAVVTADTSMCSDECRGSTDGVGRVCRAAGECDPLVMVPTLLRSSDILRTRPA